MNKFVALFGLFFGVLGYPGQTFLSFNTAPDTSLTADSLLFLEKQKLAATGTNTVQRTMAVANSFLGAPYVNGCLDRQRIEALTVNLRELDCWTFVENSLAIALSYDQNFDYFKKRLQHLRYWGGQIDGYGSRIHYFTGWLLQAEKAGILDDLSETLGGTHYEKRIGYISARKHKYPKIGDNSVLKDIQNAEKRINAHKWYFIPKSRIAKMEHLIQDGDIVCLTSAKADLDIAHQGFAVKKNGRIHLMHASSLAGRVIVAKLPLAEYTAAQRGQSGIIVARLK